MSSEQSIAEAWEKAKEYAGLAETAATHESRMFYAKLYDAWARTARTLETIPQANFPKLVARGLSAPRIERWRKPEKSIEIIG
jgi:hypothetical protein